MRTVLQTLEDFTLAQWIHILVLVLAGVASLYAYYNNMSAAGAITLVIAMVSAIAAYVSPPASPGVVNATTG